MSAGRVRRRGEAQDALRSRGERGEVVAALVESLGRVRGDTSDGPALTIGEQRVFAAARRERTFDGAEDVHDVEVAGVALAQRRHEHALAEPAHAPGARVELGGERAPEPGDVDRAADDVEPTELGEHRLDALRGLDLGLGPTRASGLAPEVTPDERLGPGRVRPPCGFGRRLERRGEVGDERRELGDVVPHHHEPLELPLVGLELCPRTRSPRRRHRGAGGGAQPTARPPSPRPPRARAGPTATRSRGDRCRGRGPGRRRAMRRRRRGRGRRRPGRAARAARVRPPSPPAGAARCRSTGCRPRRGPPGRAGRTARRAGRAPRSARAGCRRALASRCRARDRAAPRPRGRAWRGGAWRPAPARARRAVRRAGPQRGASRERTSLGVDGRVAGVAEDHREAAYGRERAEELLLTAIDGARGGAARRGRSRSPSPTRRAPRPRPRAPRRGSRSSRR